MADKKVTDLGTPSGGVASGDKLYLVDISDTTDNVAGSSRADTMANIVTKGHGLSDGVVKVASGTMAPATAGTDYYAPGSTDVAVADGGTGASTASGARTNLSLVPGTDIQAFDTDLASLAGLTLSQGDILYRNGTQLTNLPAGTSGQFLSTGGAGANVSWVSGALASFDAIVASSGGTHTTLRAAILAASSGWRILVFDGTTETSSISSSLTNLTIVGANKYGSVVNMGANSLTLSGLGVVVDNVGFNISNAACTMTFSGGQQVVRNCAFDEGAAAPTGGNDKITISSAGSVFDGNEVVTSSNNASAARYLSFSSTGGRVVNNYFKTGPGASVVPGQIAIYLSGAKVIFDGNNITMNAVSSGTVYMQIGGDYNAITSNTFIGSSTSVSQIPLQNGGNYTSISNNTFQASNLAIDSYLPCTITGNNITLGYATSGIGIFMYSNGGQVCSGNSVVNLNGSKGGDGIKSTSDDNIITSNRVNNFTNGVNINGAGTDRNVVVGNALNNNTNGLVDTGTGTVSASNS